MDLKDRKINAKFNVLAIICIILFCFAVSPVSLQNDTFYTIKIGEYITQNGIDMQDHFSWHKDLAYTYPHWAYDTGIYLIYHLGEITQIPNGGMLFVYISTVILACVLGIVIYLTTKKISKDNLISFLFTLLAMYLLKDFIAARAQLVTFILFVLTILFIEKFLESNKKRYLVYLVLIAIIIANVHVAVWPFFFVLFMPYIGEYIIACIIESNIIYKIKLYISKKKIDILEKKSLKEKNEDAKKIIEQKIVESQKEFELKKQEEEKKLEKAKQRRENPYKISVKKNKAVKWIILVMVMCVFTGLLTPLKDTPYTYLIKTMQGNTTKSISEHQPLTLFNNINMMLSFALVIGILIFTKLKVSLKDLFMVGGLMFLTFMSRRQASIFVLMVIPIFAKWIAELFETYDKGGTKKFAQLMQTWAGKIVTVLIIIICCLAIWAPKKNEKFVDDTKYPVEASNWILNNLDVENIRIYNEYNYGSYLLFKGIPVFIDSRADLYAPEFNKTEEKEGRDIFSDYINISSINLYYEDKFEEYDITHVVVLKKSKLNMFLSRNKDYKELYKDDRFVIYERNI